jgi:hypothetical protein
LTVLHRSDLVGQDLFMEPEHGEREYPRQDPMQVLETLLGVKGVHVIGMVSKPGSVRAVIETLEDEVVCSECGTSAEPAGRPVREIVDLPAFGRTVIFEWHVRRWRCVNPECPTRTWEEELPPVGSAQWAQRREK